MIAGHQERGDGQPDRRAGERARAGIGVAGLGAHRADDAGLELPLDDVGGHLVAVGRRHLAGEGHGQRHVGVGVGQRRQVGAALEDHQVARAAQRDVDARGVAVHVRQLGQFGERQVGEHRLRADVVVAVVVRDRHLVAERQAVEQLRALVVGVARLGRRDDLARHPVVGRDRDATRAPARSRRPSARSAAAATQGRAGDLRRCGTLVIVPDSTAHSGSARPRIANGRGSPAKW